MPWRCTGIVGIRRPLLLVQQNAIPAATSQELTRLQPQQIVVLGGQGSVSAGVATALDAFTTGPVTRLAGQTNRYQTAAAISQFAFPTRDRFRCEWHKLPGRPGRGPGAPTAGRCC